MACYAEEQHEIRNAWRFKERFSLPPGAVKTENSKLSENCVCVRAFGGRKEKKKEKKTVVSCSHGHYRR